MRIKTVPKDQVPEGQKQLYEAFAARVAKDYPTITTTQPDGAFIGPWGVWLQTPETGEAIRRLIEVIGAMPGLKKPTVQAVILATGAWFNADYALYAHAAVGKSVGLSDAQVAMLAAGGLPADLDSEAMLVVQTARRLLAGGVLPAPVFARAIAQLGQAGFDHLIYTVSQYCLVSISLNAYAMPGDYDVDPNLNS